MKACTCRLTSDPQGANEGAGALVSEDAAVSWPWWRRDETAGLKSEIVEAAEAAVGGSALGGSTIARSPMAGVALSRTRFWSPYPTGAMRRLPPEATGVASPMT